MDDSMKTLPWENGQEEEPLHLLEALHRTLLHSANQQDSRNIPKRLVDAANSPFRSATDLKAKGIHFRRSSPCLTDIQFFSFAFYGQLRLPFFYITHNTMTFFSNLIAFELSPETDTNCGVTSYGLRESGILNSTLANDEEVLTMFQSIGTYGFCEDALICDLKVRIDKHCKSKVKTWITHCKRKAKTWIPQLINTRFRSPWTVIALLVSAFLLCLTFLQTYYTINPRNTYVFFFCFLFLESQVSYQ